MHVCVGHDQLNCTDQAKGKDANVHMCKYEQLRQLTTLSYLPLFDTFAPTYRIDHVMFTCTHYISILQNAVDLVSIEHICTTYLLFVSN